MGILERMGGALLPDEGQTCEHCDFHNTDIWDDNCENCGRNRKESDDEDTESED